MSRLPELERELFRAAKRLDQQHERRPVKLRRLGGTPLLVGAASLLLAGGALAAVTGLLDDGSPVPAAPRSELLTPSAATFSLADARAADPDGGPRWAIGRYTAKPAGAVPNAQAVSLTCLVIGRVQGDQLGVVGRDGVFGNDGLFHRLSPGAQASDTCGGGTGTDDFRLISSGPPVPASGYTGPPGTRIGGCRERVKLDGPTVSSQTRRRLKNVPECASSSLRFVIAGFAGRRPVEAAIAGRGYPTQTTPLDPSDDGAYLFVVEPIGKSRPKLTFTLRDGTTCPALPVIRAGRVTLPDPRCA